MSQANLPYIAVTAAVALTLAGANYNQLSSYLASQGDTQNASSCPSFTFQSYGDPHIITQINNGMQQDVISNESLSNFASIANTADGTTQISSLVQNYAPLNEMVNQSVTITHTGTNPWSLTSTDASGAIAGTITDANGTHSFANGQTYYESDGTTITVENNVVNVVQKLSLGGIISTNIQTNETEYAGTDNAVVPGVNLSVQGRGEAVINGTATQQATGSDNAILPCMSPAGSGGSSGTGSDSSNGSTAQLQQTSM